jgi:hypothetical protein
MLEYGIDRFSWNAGEQLSIYAAQRATTARNKNILFTPKRAEQL